jgi:hypothetical protein
MAMKRLAIRVTMAGALAASGACASGAAAAAPVSASHVRLRHFVCQRAMDPAARAVSTTAVMHSVDGATKLLLRFQLLSQTKRGGPWASIPGGDLNAWISPNNQTLGIRAGDIWILNKQVVNLAAPATYHFRVFFRWIGAHNRVLGQASRDSANCVQPELRPDLAMWPIEVASDPTDPNFDFYTATIRNNGVTAAGSFQVLFAPGGGAPWAPVRSSTVSGLPAHTTTTFRFRGPVCSSTVTPTISADPTGMVDDYNRANNAKTAACPAGALQARRRALA